MMPKPLPDGAQRAARKMHSGGLLETYKSVVAPQATRDLRQAHANLPSVRRGAIQGLGAKGIQMTQGARSSVRSVLPATTGLAAAEAARNVTVRNRTLGGLAAAALGAGGLVLLDRQRKRKLEEAVHPPLTEPDEAPDSTMEDNLKQAGGFHLQSGGSSLGGADSSYMRTERPKVRRIRPNKGYVVERPKFGSELYCSDCGKTGSDGLGYTRSTPRMSGCCRAEVLEKTASDEDLQEALHALNPFRGAMSPDAPFKGDWDRAAEVGDRLNAKHKDLVLHGFGKAAGVRRVMRISRARMNVASKAVMDLGDEVAKNYGTGKELSDSYKASKGKAWDRITSLGRAGSVAQAKLKRRKARFPGGPGAYEASTDMHRSMRKLDQEPPKMAADQAGFLRGHYEKIATDAVQRFLRGAKTHGRAHTVEDLANAWRLGAHTQPRTNNARFATVATRVKHLGGQSGPAWSTLKERVQARLPIGTSIPGVKGPDALATKRG